MSIQYAVNQWLNKVWGYEIRRVRHPNKIIGIDVFADMQSILGKNSKGILLDVGANVGQFALSLVKYQPQATIYSFEPYSAAFQKLDQNTQNWANIIPVNLALGSENITQKLYIHQYPVMNSLLDIAKSEREIWGPMENQVDVEVMTLDHWISTNNISSIDLLKVDTQGYDLEVLKGASNYLRQNLVKLALVEVNFIKIYENQIYFEDIYGFLKTFGFNLVGLYDTRCQGKQPFIGWGNALFIKT